LIGLVLASSEAGVVGTITSDGTDVIEMSARTAGSTAGGTVEVVEVVAGAVVSAAVAGIEGSVTATVVETLVGATSDGEPAEMPDEVGVVEAEVPELHAAINITAVVRRSSRAGRGFDLTGAPSAQ
jgi:hypothetical protein